MKPFNLERTLAGDKIVTRDGREARFIAYVPEAKPNFKVLVLIEGEIYSMWDSGNYWDGVKESPNDLFMAPKIRTLWANLHTHGMWTRHNTQKEADDYDRRSGGVRLGNKAYKIEIEE